MAAPTEIMRPTNTVGWKSGFNTIKRVTRLALKSPWMVAIALVSTVIAAGLQLMVPILLGRAVDQTQALVSDSTTTETATADLWVTAGSVRLGFAWIFYRLSELF